MTCTRCKQHIDPQAQPHHWSKRGYHHAVCPPQPSEAQIQQACTQLLELDGWRALRTDPCSDKARGKGFGEVGMADHLYIRYGHFDHFQTDYRKAVAEVLFVEWKRPGGKPTTQQIAWHGVERARGALTLIAGVDFTASVEWFWEWYCRSGLKRKDIKVK